MLANSRLITINLRITLLSSFTSSLLQMEYSQSMFKNLKLAKKDSMIERILLLINISKEPSKVKCAQIPVNMIITSLKTVIMTNCLGKSSHIKCMSVSYSITKTANQKKRLKPFQIISSSLSTQLNNMFLLMVLGAQEKIQLLPQNLV